MVKIRKDRTYIWERQEWPSFRLDMERISPVLTEVVAVQGYLLGLGSGIDGRMAKDAAAASMAQEIVANSAIEGVALNPEAVRSSVMLRLGITSGGMTDHARRVDSIVGVLTEAVAQWERPLALDDVFRWQQALFPKGYSRELGDIRVGMLRGEEPMVVSSRGKRLGDADTIHYEAPERARLETEIAQFLDWFNGGWREHGLLRAGLAHLWFVTIHPLEDGNGRIARTITGPRPISWCKSSGEAGSVGWERSLQ